MRGLLYIVIILVLAGCGYTGTSPKVLDEAQSLMQDNPAAALSKLNGMDISSFNDSATMARWALLYSEALVENRLTAPTDTIIEIAIDYYGRHKNSVEYDKANRLKARIKSITASNELAAALYLQKEKEFFLYREKIIRERITYIGLFILLLACGIIVWMRQRMNLQNIQNSILIAEASSLRNTITAGQGDVDRLENKLRNLLSERFSLIDTLCQTYYETQGTKTERKAIVDKVKSEIEAVRTDSFVKMEQAVNDCRDNLLLKVRKAFPSIKTEDYQLLVYLASGLSTRSISLLLNESVEVIYKRKSRLKSRLKDAVAPSYPEIMTVF